MIINKNDENLVLEICVIRESVEIYFYDAYVRDILPSRGETISRIMEESKKADALTVYLCNNDEPLFIWEIDLDKQSVAEGLTEVFDDIKKEEKIAA